MMKTQKKVSEKKARQQEPIAIVGIGCRFPGEINDPPAFWELLTRGQNAVTEVPTDRWSLSKFYDPDSGKAGKIKNSKGGFVKNIDHFDAQFFNIFPSEAHRMDPQQRLLLEVTYQALEDAGISLENFSGSHTAVFMGVFMNDYWDIQTSALQGNAISPHVPMGVSLTAIANRLSYVYNLKGPSVTLDTACSSSLVGVHLACQSIWNGESTQALAGGVNAILRPESSVMMSKGGFLSPDGACKTYDSRANGYVRSEGCGVVVLKSLSQAQADGDPIYATILGSAVNQDGHTEEGFTVPSLSSQVEMLRTAYQNAGVSPRQVAYVEAHGTGTPVGDPIETNAFGEVLGKDRTAEEKYWVGSVKTNIGHAEAAAGIAGLIKLALVLQHQKIPQNLHFEHPNPKIPFEQYRIQVPTELVDLPETDQPAIGGVNSFGAGGTNAHIVMQAYGKVPEEVDQPMPQTEEVRLFTLSGQSEAALKANATAYVDFLTTNEVSLADLCFTTQTRRSHHQHRLTIAARTQEELHEKLLAFLQDETRPGMHMQKHKKGHVPKLGFIYSGQGPQWFAMGQQLIQSSPVFKETILKIDRLFSQIADWSLLEEMNRDEATSRVSDTRIAQPAIMAVQIGLTELWKSWGVVPTGCVGHSIGEVAAAYAAGALTLGQAVEVIYHRSRGQNRATGKGKMLAAALTLDEAQQAIQGIEDTVSIAAINGPNMMTFSGDVEPLERLAQRLDERDIFHRFLRVNVPFHSHHMEPLQEELIDSLTHLVPGVATRALYSTVTGQQEDGLHLDSDYWYRNVREPVYFTDALQQMIHDGFDTFIEIAPHPVLTTGAANLLKVSNVKNALIVPSLRRKEDETLTMMGSLGMLHIQGYPMDWSTLKPEAYRLVKLPAYVWQHERYWFETPEQAEQRLGTPLHPHLASFQQSATHPNQFSWNLQLDPKVHPYVEEHKVDGTVIFPGTGHLEVAYAAAQQSFGEDFGFLQDIHFESALFLPEEEEAMEIRLEVASDEGSYRIYSRSGTSRSGASRSVASHSGAGEEKAPWTMHSRGVMNHLKDRFKPRPQEAVSDIRQRMSEAVSVSDFYLELKEGGLQYGEAFRNISRLWKGEDELLSELKMSKQHCHGLDAFNVHPALLDACLHTILHVGKWTNEEGRMGIYLPVYIEQFKIYRPLAAEVWCHVQLRDVQPDYLRGDYCIFDKQGELVAEIRGLRCKYIEGSRGETADEVYRGMYAYGWEKAEEEATVAEMTRVNGDATGGCIIFGDSQSVSAALLERFQADNLYPIFVEKGDAFHIKENNHYKVNPSEQGDIEKVLSDITARGYRVERLLYLWGLDSKFNDTLTTDELDAQQRTLAEHTLNTLRTIVSHSVQHDNQPLLYIVTQGATGVEPTEPVNVSQAALCGMGRVLMNESPFVRTSLVDLPALPDDAALATLYEQFTLVEKTQYPEIAIREERVLVRKLQAVEEETAEQAATEVWPAYRTRYQATVKDYGTLDGIQFRQTAPTPLQPQEVEIEVRAAGLNFKDIMNVMGLLDDEAVQGGIAGKNLGLECAGVITKTGSQVTDLRVGDEVMAWAAHCYAGYTVTPATCVVRKPQALSFEEAATITVVYLTAHYSLNYLARLSAEDTVLIHAASGGVGIAAVRLAQRAGATIIATAGTEEKRTYVRSLGVAHVFDSRSLSFADQVMEVTEGRGVDVVLNSLSGPGIIQNIKCLAPFGRFIEIGKADIYQDTPLALKRFGENLSYHAVDVDRLMLQKPQLGQRLYQEVANLFAEEPLAIHPHQVYPVAKLSEALRVLSKGGHIGKLVVTMRPEDKVEVLPSQQLTLDANATYLITGGASGFGIVMAQWLADKGARSLVLLSRSGYKHTHDYRIAEELKERGVDVYSLKLDITNAQAVSEVVKYVRTHLPPLKGIIHSAAVLEDATLMNTDTERYMKVFRPKALGAWNLHQATQEDSLDFFLMFSSISSIFGLPGQSNYSAANNFLDRLAQHRQSQGLAGSSVNLGALGLYAGMSKDAGNVMNVIMNQGWLPLTFMQVTQKIETILLQKPAVRLAANLDWKRFRGFFLHLQKDARFAEFMQDTAQGSSKTGKTLVDQLRAVPAAEQSANLQTLLAESLAKILGSSPEHIETDVSITSIGLDSLMLNQLRNWIQQKLEINFPLMKIAKGPSIFELAGLLLEEINQEETREEVSTLVVPSSFEDTSGIASQADIEVLSNGWLVRNKHNRQPIRHRVFCFHPVGAGASMFNHFLYNPPTNTDVLAVQLPGRENRRDEAPYGEVTKLVDTLAEVIQPYLDQPFSIMGHSFGGIIGYELIHRLQQEQGIRAEHLFITGTIAPQLTKKWRTRDAISKTAEPDHPEQRILSLVSYIDDVEFIKRILPVMRHDMPLIMSYPYQERDPLNIPITAFAAEQDEVVLIEEVREWRAQTSEAFSLEVVSGDHWFLSRNQERILERLQEAVMTSVLA